MIDVQGKMVAAVVSREPARWQLPEAPQDTRKKPYLASAAANDSEG